MKISKKGFTIAEMLVCFTVVGILASMLIPSIINNKPNKNMAMVRKAYQITERAVLELISDEDNFPSESVGSDSLAYFDTAPDATRTQDTTGIFFCEQFAARLNTNNKIKCDESKNYASEPSFTTNDGIFWYIPSKTIICDPEDEDANPKGKPCKLPTDSEIPTCPADGAKSPFICIYYDVNGDDSPNELLSTASDVDTVRGDRGWFYVYWNGKVVPPKGQTERYLNSTDAFDNKYLQKEKKTD